MKEDEVQAWDWDRILFGQTPAVFIVEVFIRTLFIYLLLLVILRLLGKRMDGQLTLTEMAVMVTFGAIVAVPMQLPDKGLLSGIIALVYALIFQRGLNWLTVKNKALEDITQGTLSILVKDGLIQLNEMQKARISKQHLFTELRGQKIYNLGKVKRLYFEACGMMNPYLEHADKPGLSFPRMNWIWLKSTRMLTTQTLPAKIVVMLHLPPPEMRPAPTAARRNGSKLSFNIYYKLF
jgi:uncharacterized membrane protein YcaP (DUF421 family)